MQAIEDCYASALRERLADVIVHRAAWAKRLDARARVVSERPALFSVAQHDALAAAALDVTNALVDVPRRLFGDDIEALARFLGEPMLASPWFVGQYARAREQLLARPDTIFDGAHYKVIDQNVSSAIGGYDRSEVIGAYFAEHPATASVGREFGLRVDSMYAALASSVGLLGPRAAKLLVYDVPDSLPRRQHWAPRVLIDDLRARGVDVETVDDARLPAALRSRSRERVVVLRAFVPTVMRGAAHRYRRFRALAAAGRVRVLNNPWETAFFDKLLLACLSDPRLLRNTPTPVQRRLRQIVPWTRVLRHDRVRFRRRAHDLLDLVVTERHHFVLKRGNSFSARHVRVGLATPSSSWQRAVSRAVREGGWIVQELVPGVWERTQALVDDRIVDARAMVVDSPYLVDGRPAGILRRERLAPLPGSTQPNLPRSVGTTIGVVHGG